MYWPDTWDPQGDNYPVFQNVRGLLLKDIMTSLEELN